MDAAMNLQNMRKLDDSWNRQDLPTFRKYHAKDCIVRWPNQPPTHGVDAHEQEAIAFFKMFPDQHLINNPYKIMLGQGEWTCTVADFTGTMKGPMIMPDGTVIQPTNKSFHIDFCTVARWNDEGQIVEENLFYDLMGMLKQIGVMADQAQKAGLTTRNPKMGERMPALFFGHGNPMNALLVNSYTQRWEAIGAALPRPKAILSVSAHWYIEDAAVTVSTAPRTIHDFGGFPRELYEVQYPAPGDLRLAERVQKLLAPTPVRRDDRWGLDHGTWSVLRHVYPQADIPIVQLSIDETQPPSSHYEISKRLALLREEGILILGSGNLVHNLHAYAWGRRVTEPYDWAIAFEKRVRELLVSEDYKPLLAYENQLGNEAELAVPTPEHYLPLLYVIGTRAPSEQVAFPVEGVDGGSVSMLALQVG